MLWIYTYIVHVQLYVYLMATTAINGPDAPYYMYMYIVFVVCCKTINFCLVKVVRTVLMRSWTYEKLYANDRHLTTADKETTVQTYSYYLCTLVHLFRILITNTAIEPLCQCEFDSKWTDHTQLHVHVHMTRTYRVYINRAQYPVYTRNACIHNSN